MVKTEFQGTDAKEFENNGICNFQDLREYALKKGFEYSESRTVTLRKGTVKISVPVDSELEENEFTLSIVLGEIREQLTKAKHSAPRSNMNRHY